MLHMYSISCHDNVLKYVAKSENWEIKIIHSFIRSFMELLRPVSHTKETREMSHELLGFYLFLYIFPSSFILPVRVREQRCIFVFKNSFSLWCWKTILFNFCFEKQDTPIHKNTWAV